MFPRGTKWWEAALLFTLPLVARGKEPALPEVTFEAVPRVPGAFQTKGKVPLTAGGKPLDAKGVVSRAGMPRARK